MDELPPHQASAAHGREFPRHRAFVIQLSATSDPGGRMVSGRVEHISSGRRATFRCVEEVWAFMRETLLAGDSTRDGPEVRPPADSSGGEIPAPSFTKTTEEEITR